MNILKLILPITIILFILEAVLFSIFKALLHPSILLAITNTNINEAEEFFSSYNISWHIVSIIFLVLLIWGAICVMKRHIPTTMKICVPQPVLWICTSIILISYGTLHLYFGIWRNGKIEYQNYSLIERFIISVTQTYMENQKFKTATATYASHTPIVTRNSPQIPYVVLIIGESVTRNYLNAYGYPLNNTPYLNKRKSEGETLQFDSIKAPGATTLPSLQKVLTFYDHSSDKGWYNYFSLPSIMRAAGYRTYWLSNQECMVNIYSNSIMTIAHTSEKAMFTKNYKGCEDGLHDERLFPLLNEILQQSNHSNGNFICIHQMGCHSRYNYRYPHSFDKFSSNDIQKEINHEAKEIIAQYNNAILYNDYINNEILKRFEDKDAIVFIFSDHGEEVFQTRSMFGHTDANPSLPMLEIPLFIWSSQSFRKNHGDIINQLSKQTKKPYNTENLIHTIMDICSISSSDFNKNKSLLGNE